MDEIHYVYFQVRDTMVVTLVEMVSNCVLNISGCYTDGLGTGPWAVSWFGLHIVWEQSLQVMQYVKLLLLQSTLIFDEYEWPL